MYGTIARLTLRSGSLEELRRLGAETSAALASTGFLWEHTFQSDADPNEVWLVVAFKDREAYMQNAADPAQHERYVRMRALLAADPEWHDGTIIDSQSV